MLRALGHPAPGRARGPPPARPSRRCCGEVAGPARGALRLGRSCCAPCSARSTAPSAAGHYALASRVLHPLHLADPALPRPRRPPAPEGAARAAAADEEAARTAPRRAPAGDRRAREHDRAAGRAVASASCCNGRRCASSPAASASASRGGSPASSRSASSCSSTATTWTAWCRSRSLGDDYFRYEPEAHRLVGERPGGSSSSPTRSRWSCVGVDLRHRGLDLKLADMPRPPPRRGRRGAARRPARADGRERGRAGGAAARGRPREDGRERAGSSGPAEPACR